MNPPGERIALLAPMRSELKAVVRAFALESASTPDAVRATGQVGSTRFVAALTGIGTGAARRVTQSLLEPGEIDRVVVIGIAGGIGSTLTVGGVLWPEVVLDIDRDTEHRPTPPTGVEPRGALATSGDLVTDPSAIDELEARGVIAIDMETAAVAAVCEERSVPWSVVRSISDPAEGGAVGEVIGLVGPEGEVRVAPAMRFLARRPHRLPLMVGLARDAQRAANRAARAAAEGFRAEGTGPPA